MDLILHKEHLIYTIEAPDEVKSVVCLGHTESELEVKEIWGTPLFTRVGWELRWQPDLDSLRSFGDAGGISFIEQMECPRHVHSLGGGEVVDCLGE